MRFITDSSMPPPFNLISYVLSCLERLSCSHRQADSEGLTMELEGHNDSENHQAM